MKICYTGGGTLGHIYPAIAVNDELKVKVDITDVYWIGRKNPKEKTVVEQSNIEFISISCGKLRRYFSFSNFFDIFKIIAGFFQSLLILKRRKPDLVFSKGGFVSVPVVIAASVLNIPVVTHESDFSFGLATKINSRYAKKVCMGFEREDLNSEKYVFTGNPLRTDLRPFLDINRDHLRNLLIKKDLTALEKFGLNESLVDSLNSKFDWNKKVILVIGGSLGSLEVNNLIYDNLDYLLSNYNIIHQTGSNMKEINKKGYLSKETFSTELGLFYVISDLIVSRSGASALNEIMNFKKISLLIPLIRNSRGEQRENARYYKEKGCCEVFDNSEKSQNFIDTINYLLNNKEKRALLNASLNNLDVEDAVDRITNVLLSI